MCFQILNLDVYNCVTDGTCAMYHFFDRPCVKSTTQSCIHKKLSSRHCRCRGFSLCCCRTARESRCSIAIVRISLLGILPFVWKQQLIPSICTCILLVGLEPYTLIVWRLFSLQLRLSIHSARLPPGRTQPSASRSASAKGLRAFGLGKWNVCWFLVAL